MFFSKIIFNLFLLLFFSVKILSAQSSVQQRIDNLLKNDFFKSTNISIVAYDAQTGKTLFEKNPDLLLHPASNMKILTSAAGLFFLGTDYKFLTSLYYTGEIINNTLFGDLFIVGGCDPDFSSKDLDSLVNILFSKGIKEIAGKIYGDISMSDSLFWGSGWMWDDDLSTDAPYLSSLNINDNTIGIALKGTVPGRKAEIYLKPETAFVEIINKTLTVSSGEKSKIKVKRNWLNKKNIFIIEGTVAADKNELSDKDYEYYTLFKPEEYFLTLFQEELVKKDIKFSYPIEFTKTPLEAAHLFSFQRGYDRVIVSKNKISDNLSAEMTIYALAAKYFGAPASAENGLKLVDSLISLAGFEPQNFQFADGSGVSRYNLVSSNLILGVLKYIYLNNPELYKLLYDSFPIAGVDGTLKQRMIGTKAENNVHAKTGTLNGVSTLSGYLNSSSGNLIIFSIFIQNYIVKNRIAKNYEDEICKILVESY